MDKKEIRDIVMSKKKALLPLEICRVSRPVIDYVFSMPEFVEAEAVYCYMEFNQEIITHPIITKSWEMGKRVAAPKVVGDDMEFYYIRSFEDVTPGYMGILEPVDTVPADEKKAFVIMPGLAYDLDFNRIGYGGGFYDRFLASHREYSFFKTAIVYDFQIFDHFDTEEFDIPVDAIVSSKRVYRRDISGGQ